MLDVTKKFLNTIDDTDRNGIIKDDGYYSVYLCEELGKKYMEEHGGNVNKTINAFNEVYDDKDASYLLRCMAGVCICVIKLRVAKTREDVNLQKNSVEGISKFLNMIDNVI